MCVIVAKYFSGIGWAGAKNRDRTYVPTLEFIIDDVDGTERVMMHDQITGYKEGINSKGVSILNTSLDVLDDEREVEAGTVDSSPDGKYISEALTYDDPLDAAKYLISKNLVGCTIVFNEEDLYLIEASDQDGTKPYRYTIKKIPHDQLVARTNHGKWLEWSGFQRKTDNENETLDRISSESRLAQAESVVQEAKTPEDLVNGMCKVYIENPQLNIMRTSTGRKKMRTTSQQLCVPRERTLFCRPVSSNLQFDFWKLNQPNRKAWVELLSNRELWNSSTKPKEFAKMNLKDVE